MHRLEQLIEYNGGDCLNNRLIASHISNGQLEGIGAAIGVITITMSLD